MVKVFCVCGVSKSGKTTTIEQIIRGLRARGYKVGSVKQIHARNFSIDPDPTKDTARHRLAGSELVTARGLYETSVLFQGMLDTRKILSFYEGFDFVVLEGTSDVPMPTIVAANTPVELDDKWSDKTFCVSGRIADEITQYKGVPAISAITDSSALVDLIELKVHSTLPDSDAQNCFACGRNYRKPGAEILQGKVKRFASRRNEVFLHNGHVVKRLRNAGYAGTEAGLLNRYRRFGVSVPSIIEVLDNDIIMEYIPGDTIPDFLARMEKEPDDDQLREAALGLCRWLEVFYEAVNHNQSGEIRGDVNGRNFIVSAGQIISVDFEECVFGIKEQDVGRLLAFIRTYDLSGTSVKRRFSSLFGEAAEKKLALSREEILKQYKQELIAIKKRRSKRLGL